MKDFASWIAAATSGYEPRLVANPIIFDGMFISYYFDNFFGQNPFGHGGDDIGSLYKGTLGKLDASIKDLQLRPSEGLTHNALDDALQQAKEFEAIVELLQKKH